MGSPAHQTAMLLVSDHLEAAGFHVSHQTFPCFTGREEGFGYAVVPVCFQFISALFPRLPVGSCQ